MKHNNINRVLILSLSTVVMIGCAPKRELVVVSPKRVIVPSHNLPIQNEVPRTKVWKKFQPIKRNNFNNKECIDCYATPINQSRVPSVSHRNFTRNVQQRAVRISSNRYQPSIDYSLPPSVNKKRFTPPIERTFKTTPSKKIMENTKYYGSYAYSEKVSDRINAEESYENSNRYLLPVISSMNNAYDNFSDDTGISIQVGAFRQYSGAKQYMRRYSALSSKYRVVIKEGEKENQPIYRVQIKGFENDMVAKRFMDSYGIEGAFLVRR